MPKPRPDLHKRILAIMLHTTRYSVGGAARLAKDAGVSRSTVTRFLRGESNPSVFVVLALLEALERQLGRHVDLRELISLDGTYPTPVCALMDCPGCLPPHYWNKDDTLKEEYKHSKGGEWPIPSPESSLAEEAV